MHKKRFNFESIMVRVLLFISLNCILFPVFGQPLTYDFSDDWVYSKGVTPNYLFDLKRNLEIISVRIEGEKTKVNYHYQVNISRDSIWELKAYHKRDKRYYKRLNGVYVLTDKKGKRMKYETDSTFNVFDTILNRNDTVVLSKRQYYTVSLPDSNQAPLYYKYFYRDTLFCEHYISFYDRIEKYDQYYFYSYPDRYTKLFSDSIYNLSEQKFRVSKSKLQFKLDSDGKVIYLINSKLLNHQGKVGPTYEFRYFYLEKVCIKQDEYLDGELKSVIEIKFIE